MGYKSKRIFLTSSEISRIIEIDPADFCIENPHKVYLPRGKVKINEDKDFLYVVGESWAILRFSSDFETGYTDDYFSKTPKQALEYFRREMSAGFSANTISPVYRIGGEYFEDNGDSPEERGFRWNPPTTMPSWVSRIVLKHFYSSADHDVFLIVRNEWSLLNLKLAREIKDE